MKTIFFGNYSQSNSKEKEPIEWIVIKEEIDKMYVMSKYCLDHVPYSDGNKIAWENSFARKWLNSDFIKTAFSKEEQQQIVLSDIRTSRAGFDVPELDKGDAVKDKVFLPSLAEVFLYFKSNVWHDIVAEQKRIARPTPFAYERGCYIYPLKYSTVKDNELYKEFMGSSFDETALYWNWDYDAAQNNNFEKENDFQVDTAEIRWACEWYLRSPGFNVIKVCANGKVQSSGNSKGIAIRPAMWIKK